MADDKQENEVVKVIESDGLRLVVGWGHVARKADGSFPYDSQGDVVPDRALGEYQTVFYDHLREVVAKDMHWGDAIAPIVGGISISPDITKALIEAEDTYKSLVAKAEALAATATKADKDGAADLLAAIKAYPAQALRTGHLIVAEFPRTADADAALTKVKAHERPMMSMAGKADRTPIAVAA